MLQASIYCPVSVIYITASHVSPVISYLVVLDKIGPFRITRSAYNTIRTYGPHRSCYNE